MPFSRRRACAALAVAAFAAAPAAAEAAATASNSGGVLTITADAQGAKDNVGGTPGAITLSAGLFAPALGTVTGCSGGPDTYTCNASKVVFNGNSGVDELLSSVRGAAEHEFHGEGADDDFSTTADDLTGKVVAYGGSGDDALDGGSGNDLVDGGPGKDNQVRGDAGNDEVYGGDGDDYVLGMGGDDKVDGGAGNDDVRGDGLTEDDDVDFNGADGNDQVFGGEGDDELQGNLGADQFHGGGGSDTVTYDQRRGAGSLSISLDNAANDGASGENDNVGPTGDVENLEGPYDGAVTLIGNDGPNKIDTLTGGTATIDGKGGDDRVNVRTSGGLTATVAGGAGNDQIDGGGSADTIDGGDGADTIFASAGDDLVTGGPGADSIEASAGNDKVFANDGVKDTVGCGVGADEATADAIDVVNADPGSLCEVVNTVQGPGVGGPANNNPNTPAPQGIGQNVTVNGTTFRVPASGTFSLGIANLNPFPVQATTKLVSKNAIASAKKKKIALGGGSAVIKASSTGKIRIKLSKAGKKALKKNKKIVAIATTTLKGPNGVTGTVTNSLTLRRK